MSTRSVDVSALYELLYNPRYAPEQSASAHIETLTVEGKPTFILMKESVGEYFEVDATTNAIWNLVDGKKTIKQIYDEAKKTDETLSEGEVRDVIVSLAEEGIIESTETETLQKRVKVVSMFQLDINLLRNSSVSLAGFFRITRRLLKKQALPITFGIGVLGTAFFAGTFVQIFSSGASKFEVAGSSLLGLLFYQILVLAPVYLVHELAHAAACDYYGGKPRELGTGLYYLAPFFYCNTSDSWRLGRRARIMISLAGPLSTVVIVSFFVFASYLTAPGFGKDVLQIGAFFGFYGTLLNISPILETDGYYVLTDILNIPNLRDESFAYIKRVFLHKLGRSLSGIRYGVRQRRLFLFYAIAVIAWLVFTGYATLRLTYIYGLDAYRAFSALLLVILQIQPFNLAETGINLAALSYFGFLMVGYGVMGIVAYGKIRIRGLKLETIHDKRVSVFLPLPSFFPRQGSKRLVEAAKTRARRFSRSFSVTWEPPICVATLKLGKIDQSLEEIRGDMLQVERSFRSLHYEFLSKNLSSTHDETYTKKNLMADILKDLAAQFPSFERKDAILEVAQFLGRRNNLLKYLLHSAFGTVWTLELSPEDYKRIRVEIFPSLLAEDLGITDLHGELEHFKKHTVLGLETIALLSSEIEHEAGKVSRKPEVYQVTAFIEPIKSRLVFVGRTEEVKGSIVWLGGLFLYQAWTGYISEVLDEAALGLKSIRQAPSYSFAKTRIMKLPDKELKALKQDFDRFRTLRQTAEDAITRVRRTYESAKNFHETLNSLLADETFDVGLYEPILRTNDKRLANVTDKVERFQDEFRRVSAELGTVMDEVNNEYSKRMPGLRLSGVRLLRNYLLGALLSLGNRGAARNYTPVYDAGIKLLFATSRLVYDVVIGSDIVI